MYTRSGRRRERNKLLIMCSQQVLMSVMDLWAVLRRKIKIHAYLRFSTIGTSVFIVLLIIWMYNYNCRKCIYYAVLYTRFIYLSLSTRDATFATAAMRLLSLGCRWEVKCNQCNFLWRKCKKARCEIQLL